MQFYIVEVESSEESFVTINLNHIVGYEHLTNDLYLVNGQRFTLLDGEFDDLMKRAYSNLS